MEGGDGGGTVEAAGHVCGVYVGYRVVVPFALDAGGGWERCGVGGGEVGHVAVEEVEEIAGEVLVKGS